MYMKICCACLTEQLEGLCHTIVENLVFAITAIVLYINASILIDRVITSYVHLFLFCSTT